MAFIGLITAEHAVASSIFTQQDLLAGAGATGGNVTDRKEQLLELELAFLGECEALASRNRNPAVVMHDRKTWDGATWRRYLDTAATLDWKYGPAMRKLYLEIDQLDGHRSHR